jgi:hypothetical protein
MPDIPKIEPLEITAGDYIQWTKNLSDFPPGTWTLTYTLINSTNKYQLTATTSGADFLVTIAAATSAAYVAGVYKWQAYVTSGVQRYNVGSGEVKINPNFAATATLDTRTHAKKVLDAIEAVLENRASLDQEEYTIQGRSLKRTPVLELMKMRDKYRAMYISEQNAEKASKGLYGKNKLFVRI